MLSHHVVLDVLLVRGGKGVVPGTNLSLSHCCIKSVPIKRNTIHHSVEPELLATNPIEVLRELAPWDVESVRVEVGVLTENVVKVLWSDHDDNLGGGHSQRRNGAERSGAERSGDEVERVY